MSNHLSLISNKLKCVESNREVAKALIETYERKALKVFIRGVKGNVSKHFVFRKPKDLSEAFRCCQELENEERYSSNQYGCSHYPQASGRITNTNNPMGSIGPNSKEDRLSRLTTVIMQPRPWRIHEGILNQGWRSRQNPVGQDNPIHQIQALVEETKLMPNVVALMIPTLSGSPKSCTTWIQSGRPLVLLQNIFPTKPQLIVVWKQYGSSCHRIQANAV